MLRCGRLVSALARSALIGAVAGFAACVTAAEVIDEGGSTRADFRDTLTTWVLANEGPDLLDFTSESDGLHVVCEPASLRAVFDEDDGARFTVQWDLYGPRTADGTTGPLEASGSESFAIAGAPVEAYFAPACRHVGTYDLVVTATDEQGASTSFDALLHCTSPALGACLSGTPWPGVGAGSCDPAEWVILDPGCFSERFPAAPTCAALCPGAGP